MDAVSICNLALQKLGAKSITALTEDTTAGRECNRVYEHARDSELRAHPWNFARTRTSIAASSTDPVFGYAKQYQLPSDCLRILPTSANDDWQIEGRMILTDDTSPLQLVYIKKVTDPNDFDALFVELLAARIAVEITEKVTQSNTKKAGVQAHYEMVRKEARRVNAFDRVPQTTPDGSWITAPL